jgi:mannosidase alpha-like ER degradation enhancer 2
MGREFFEDFVRRCRTPAGFAALEDVRSGTQADSMESFVLAETFKYFYLLFAGPKALDFDAIVFNTEAHPLHRVATAGAQPTATLERLRRGHGVR